MNNSSYIHILVFPFLFFIFGVFLLFFNLFFSFLILLFIMRAAVVQLTNDHALYKMNNERVSFPSFRLQVLRALLTLDPNDSTFYLPKPSRLIGRYFPKLLDKNRRCNLCSLRQTRRRTLLWGFPYETINTVNSNFRHINSFFSHLEGEEVWTNRYKNVTKRHTLIIHFVQCISISEFTTAARILNSKIRKLKNKSKNNKKLQKQKKR